VVKGRPAEKRFVAIFLLEDQLDGLLCGEGLHCLVFGQGGYPRCKIGGWIFAAEITTPVASKLMMLSMQGVSRQVKNTRPDTVALRVRLAGFRDLYNPHS